MAASLLIVSGILLLLIVIAPAGLAYIALRVRDSRLTVADPQLGFKAAFHTLHMLAVVMALAGLSLSAGDLLQGTLTNEIPPANKPQLNRRQIVEKDDSFWTTAQRTAAALATSGFLFGLFFWIVLTSTNDRRYPSVRRTFLGARVGLCLLIVFVAVTASGILCVQKNPDLEPVEYLTGVVIVWLPSCVVHMLLFRLTARRPLEPDPVVRAVAVVESPVAGESN